MANQDASGCLYKEPKCCFTSSQQKKDEGELQRVEGKVSLFTYKFSFSWNKLWVGLKLKDKLRVWLAAMLKCD